MSRRCRLISVAVQPSRRVAGLRRPGDRRQQEEMAFDDGFGDVDKLAPVPLRVRAEQLERLLRVDGVPGHQDPLRLVDRGPPPERSLQAVVLAEALERDVDRARELLRRCGDDVGEDPALGRLVDVLRLGGRGADPFLLRCSVGVSAARRR